MTSKPRKLQSTWFTFKPALKQLNVVSGMQRNMSARVSICILILCLCAAANSGSIYKRRRQVVQPTWLMQPVQLPSAQEALVRVTPQNLGEAAAIRASIQKAVNEGSYMVSSSPQQFLTALGPSGQPLGATKPIPITFPMPAWPGFRMPNATWWTSRA